MEVLKIIVTPLISGIFSAICVAIPLICNHKKERAKDKSLNDKATLLTLKVEIMNLYDRYRNAEEIDRFNYYLLTELFEKYFDMGGDSYIHDVYERFKKFKIINNNGEQ